MTPWVLLFLAALVLMTGVAIYEITHTTMLSLPLSPGPLILTILLPGLAALNTWYLLHGARAIKSLSRRVPISPMALQILQLILTSVVATLLAHPNLFSPALRACVLESRWLEMYKAHDENGIRQIQDAFNCCGLRSTKHMAWPFPHGQPGTAPVIGCAERYGRTQACEGPWEGALKQSTGIEFAIVIISGLVQLAGLMYVRWGGAVGGGRAGAGRSGGARQIMGWPFFSRQSDSAQRLLPDAEEAREVHEENDEEEGYRDEEGGQSQESARRGTTQGKGYGAAARSETGPPAAGASDVNAWAESRS